MTAPPLISGRGLAKRFGRPGHEVPDDGREWDLFVHDLAGLLHHLVTVSAPERFAIGGGVMAARGHLVPRIRAALAVNLGGCGLLSAYADQLESPRAAWSRHAGGADGRDRNGA